MFLTTKSILQGKRYEALRVIHSSRHGKSNEKRDDQMIEEALNKLENRAAELQADGVIGIQISTTVWSDWRQITMIGTAIKIY